MRRILIFFLCCLMLTTAVSAADSVSDLQSSTIVSSDGTCQVSLKLTLQFSESPGQLLFPLSKDARDITLNGKSVRARSSGGFRQVDLSDVVTGAGIFTVTIAYSLPDSVYVDEDEQLLLGLDLLCGFAYPIEKMEFSVTLPGAVEADPSLQSTYHQDAVDMVLDLTIVDNRILGIFRETLMDREALRLTLPVTADMFPQPMVKRWSLSTDDIAMYACALLALVYWLLFMRCLPPKRERFATEPDGLTAGELGCALTGQGVDLTLMLISWARMGYLTIQPDKSGRVRLHKRMDMGNERSDFENRFFRTLFGKRNTVEGTGTHYARLCRKAMKHRTHMRELIQSRSGNPLILRLLCMGIGLSGGISMARALANDTVWRIVLGIIFALLGILLAYQIHNAAARVHLRSKKRFWAAIGTGLGWVVLGALAGEVGVALFVVACQWLGGLAAAYGGKRTEIGKSALEQILGLRRWMRKGAVKEFQQIQKHNPEYFYTMAPCALALGVDKTFAKKFDKTPLPPCIWLESDSDTPLTAAAWMALLRTTVDALDDRQKHFLWNKIFRK